ncbi:MAG: cupin domain-containing protein [SAR324 cluster bacterium]|nr:cupin domain-containing protein [SAR324 cluster bacterium]MCH8887111.1 cupin domain-containing protein [SAR324 cluster bacterium]
MSGKEQTFRYSLARDAKYGSGLRDYIEYRDLGFSESSNGLVRAHVLRAAKPCPEGGTGRHSHGVDFQMIYMLKGWITMEQAGEERTFHSGDSWTQPPGFKHEVKGYSDDMELIEIVMPADFPTRDEEPMG